jgi:flagellar hook-length control protein FliK
MQLADNGFQTPAMGKTPQDVGNSLFKTFLSKKAGLSTNSGASLAGLFAGKGNALQKSTNGKDPDALKTLNELLSQLGIPLGQLTLSEEGLTRLSALLEKQGMSIQEIDQLLSSLKNKQGQLELDRLITRIQDEMQGREFLNKSLIVNADQVPKVEETLFKMGLGAEEVRSIIEKSLTSDGNLDLGRFTEAMGDAFTGKDIGSKVVSLFDYLNIKTQSAGTGQAEKVLQDADARSALESLLKQSSGEIQQNVKNRIAEVLREKGIPPQEVKSFLEKLTVSHARSLMNKADLAQSDTAARQLEQESADLLNKVVIKKGQDWKKDGWRNQILDILKEEKILISKEGGKESQKELANFKINLAELLNRTGQHKQVELTQARTRMDSRVSSNTSKGETKASAFKATLNESTQESMQGRESQGLQTGSNRIDRPVSELNQTSPARTSVTLPEPLPKVLDRMIWMVQAGEQKSRILISPPELGRLDLNLVIKHGQLQANLSAENGMVKEIIEANLNQLKQQLNNLGFDVTRFDVTVGSEQHRFAEQDRHTGFGRRNRKTGRVGGIREQKIESERITAREKSDGLHQVDIHA